MKELGLIDLLHLCGFPKDALAKLVRHTHPKLNELVTRGFIDIYQAYQSKPIFDGIDYIVSFYADGATRSVLRGVFRVTGRRAATDGDAPSDCLDIPEWQRTCTYFYELERATGFEALDGRLVIDWGKGALSWVQQLKDKQVLELRPKGRCLEPFVDYLEFSLSFSELRSLISSPEAHRDWKSSLRAVAGVYLILAESTGEMYVGSAYGTEGIWGRWSQYAQTRHGDNKLLKELLSKAAGNYPERFRFSILQILPKSFTKNEVIAHESLFKKKLGSRAHGLNEN